MKRMKSIKKDKTRVATDSMGSMQIPVGVLYGASTQRAVLNFPVSGRSLPRSFIFALGQLKASCARANFTLGSLNQKMSQAVAKSAIQVRDGQFDDQFVVDVYQTGSGTSTNMNANEVIASLANQALKTKNIHPNDHVNCGQSSNDIIPTAMHVSARIEIQNNLLPNLRRLHKALSQKSKAFSKVYKIGRTHLQDATPMTLGQEFSGYAEQIKKSIHRIESASNSLLELAIGGTAVGTGINTHPQFAKEVIKDLNKTLKDKFREANNHFEAQGSKDVCVEVSGQLKTLAVALFKIANDIRFLGCGPRAGFAEIKLPAVQPGSSIMPGKVNPVMAESVMQIAARVIGNDATIAVGGLSGNFELNVMMPVIADALLESIHLLANGSKIFADKCVDGIVADKKQCESQIEKSLMLSTPLVPVIGYDRAAEIAKKAYSKGLTIREMILEEGLLDEKKLNNILKIENLI